MSIEQSLSGRMREYSEINNTRLMKQVPVIIQVDGCNFHSMTKKCKKPFDEVIIRGMWSAALNMCRHIEGAKLAYVQSDEISVLVTNYGTLNQGAWFDFRVQKLASVSASLATVGFNDWGVFCDPATFDAKCFNLSKEEVANWFIWRQQDWTRNSIQMVAQSMFTQKELQNKNHNKLQDMIFKKSGTNWNNYDTYLKRGTCVVRDPIDGRWIVDLHIPVFSQDRHYVEKFI